MIELSEVKQEFVVLYQDDNCQVLIRRVGSETMWTQSIELELSPLFQADNTATKLPDKVNQWLENNCIEVSLWTSMYPHKNALKGSGIVVADYRQYSDSFVIGGDDGALLELEQCEDGFSLVAHNDRINLSRERVIKILKAAIEWIEADS